MEVKQDIVTKTYHDIKFEELLDDLVKEIELRNYRVTRVYNIDNIKDRNKLSDDFRIGFQHYKIVEFCNLNSCAELISAHLLAGVFMPVKFIIYQLLDQNQIHISFLKPTAIAKLFASESVSRFANLFERDMNLVLEEIDF